MIGDILDDVEAGRAPAAARSSSTAATKRAGAPGGCARRDAIVYQFADARGAHRSTASRARGRSFPRAAPGMTMSAAEPTWNGARSILAVRLDSIGDLLMTTPALRALKEGRPARR